MPRKPPAEDVSQVLAVVPLKIADIIALPEDLDQYKKIQPWQIDDKVRTLPLPVKEQDLRLILIWYPIVIHYPREIRLQLGPVWQTSVTDAGLELHTVLALLERVKESFVFGVAIMIDLYSLTRAIVSCEPLRLEFA